MNKSYNKGLKIPQKIFKHKNNHQVMLKRQITLYIYFLQINYDYLLLTQIPMIRDIPR